MSQEPLPSSTRQTSVNGRDMIGAQAQVVLQAANISGRHEAGVQQAMHV